MARIMPCPACQTDALVTRIATTGVELDACDRCNSVWFDRGELFFFVKDQRGAERAITEARTAASVAAFVSPISGEAMVKLRLPDKGEGYLDPETGGVWLPGSVAQQLRTEGLRWMTRKQRGETARFKMPNLLGRTIFTLTGLYGLLTLFLIAFSLAGGMSPFGALVVAFMVAAVQFAVGPFVMDFFLGYAYQVHWIELSELPEHLQQFVQLTCAKHKMNLPRFGLISDLSPNAFTYGHTPNNARLVLTQGTLELLEEQELEGVVAHEIGHAAHWDMALMTLAQLVPMVLYYIYRFLIEVDTDDERVQAATTGVAIGAFLLYIFSEYVVLWFSRTREYHADRFGALACGSPAALGRALVKIAYGLASRAGEETTQSKGRAQAIGAMGIFDAGAAQSLAVLAGESLDGSQPPAAQGDSSAPPPRYHINPDELKGAMKWDLWNPWALWFELHSTHPLVAKRLLHLSELSNEVGEEPLVVFDLPKPESYWDEFFIDFAVKMLPMVTLITCFIVGLALGDPRMLGIGVVMMGLAMMVKLLFRYRSGAFPEMSVSTLLRQVKVSDIRPVPCTLEGRIRGKGVPGLLWSDDFVMQDDTGIMLIDHRQPLSLWEMIWGWIRGDDLIGEKVIVRGWYRRAPMPYVEIRDFNVTGVTRNSWLRHFRWASAVVIVALGVWLSIAVPNMIEKIEAEIAAESADGDYDDYDHDSWAPTGQP